MKKTLIAMFALAGVAMADSDLTYVTLPTTASIITDGTIGTNRPFEGIDNYSTDRVKSIITTKGVENFTAGTLYWGTPQGKNPGSDVVATTTANGVDLDMKARSGYAGEWVMFAVQGVNNINSLTLTFTPDTTIGCAIYSLDDQGALTMLGDAEIVSANTAKTKTVENLSIKASDLIVVAFGTQVTGGASGGAAVNVDGIKLGYTTAPVVPEPATATLSLLALAGLAARRRRH